MLSLLPLQRALDRIYRLDVAHCIDAFVLPMDPSHPHAARREVVLVGEFETSSNDAASPDATDAVADDVRTALSTEIAVLLDPEVSRVLVGGRADGLSRFGAWCLALEGVSHFLLLAYRAANDRPVSQLELEIQAEVDKFAVALLDRVMFLAASEAHRRSRELRRALFSNPSYVDPPDTVRGQRYRNAHRVAARYAASLEARHVREPRLNRLVEELRDFYRAGLATKCAMADAA